MEKLLKTVFDSYRNVNSVEIEFRFGRMNGAYFDTNIGRENFDYLRAGLDAFDGWEDVSSTHTTLYYNGKTRLILDEDTGEQEAMVKENIYKHDFALENLPLDLRFSVSTETPIHDDISDLVMDGMRVRKRKSYTRKNLRIDLTEVSGDPEDLDSEEVTTYQLEMEIVNPKKIKTDEEFFNIVHKHKNILNLIPLV